MDLDKKIIEGEFTKIVRMPFHLELDHQLTDSFLKSLPWPYPVTQNLAILRTGTRSGQTVIQTQEYLGAGCGFDSTSQQ